MSSSALAGMTTATHLPANSRNRVGRSTRGRRRRVRHYPECQLRYIATRLAVTADARPATGSLSPGTIWIFAAQSGGSGTAHPTSGDTYTLTYTAGATTFTTGGHF